MHDLYCYTPVQELLGDEPWYQAANGRTRMRFQITAAWFHWYLMKFFGSATFRYRLLSGKRAESSPGWKRDSVFWNVAPMRFVSLLQHTRRHSALGAVLSARGELLVLFGGRILYSWDGTRWQVYPGQVITRRLLREFAERHTGCSHSINEHVGRYLMTLALTLRDERLGGLLIWTYSEDDLHKVLANSLATETAAERYYAGLFLGKHVCSIPPMFLSNVASLDGAVVVDCSGIVRGIGKLFSSNGKRFEGEGARTRAAGFASQFGILLKVSQDGEVDLYSDGVRIAQGFETTL